MVPEFARFTQFKVIVIIWLAFSAVADVLITASLVWHLVRSVRGDWLEFVFDIFDTDTLRFSQRKNKTGMSITDHLIDRIIRSESLEPFIPIWKHLVTDCASFLFYSVLSFSHRRSNRPNRSCDSGLRCH